jgi:hypothetical protein
VGSIGSLAAIPGVVIYDEGGGDDLSALAVVLVLTHAVSREPALKGTQVDTHPYYRRRTPTPQDPNLFGVAQVDLFQHHLPPYPLGDSRPLANSLFDSRAAATVSAAVGNLHLVKVQPTSSDLDPDALLERKRYGDSAPTILILTPKCLAVMAYEDYFPGAPNAARLRPMVSEAILAASPGWCGTFGPDVNDQGVQHYEGNYDMTQMFLLPLAYGYYDLLTPEAREKLINQLLANGRIHRASLDDTLTSGGAPNDWSRAGRVSFADIGITDLPETENHVLMIATARYLTNQLLYPRHQGELWYDNRRNGDKSASRPNCLDQVLELLRNELRDDFAEYNAKPYQEETRRALLNLYSFAYAAEVRLGAGMVLDYVSAHIAVSSCDLRRLVPFRRRNEPKNVHQDPGGFTDVDLLDGAHGADPMAAHFALHAGNTRAYALPDKRVWPGESWEVRPWPWAISRAAAEPFHEAACDHRLAPSVHDLFVNDLHRRFYQRLHRKAMTEEGDQRNTDNLEIYAGSPSYLISAGGRPAIWVIPGKMSYGYQQQNLGVAVPISFMPAGAITGASTSDSRELIQIMHLSDLATPENGIQNAEHGATENYGVAPDFACGVDIHLPAWTKVPSVGDGLFWVNQRSSATELAGFYLAIHRWGSFVVLEAFDTWRHPEVSFDDFKARVTANSPRTAPASGVEAVYTTFFGNRIHYKIWQNLELDNHVVGSKILNIEYAGGDPADTLANAGNDSEPFLSGNIMTSPHDGVVEIRNPSLATILTLDWRDPHQLVRTSETGEVQQAGGNFEVWVDFDWHGAMEGDFHRPFNTLAAAVNAVANGGVIRIVHGAKRERLTIHKRVRLKAVGGTVVL